MAARLGDLPFMASGGTPPIARCEVVAGGGESTTGTINDIGGTHLHVHRLPITFSGTYGVCSHYLGCFKGTFIDLYCFTITFSSTYGVCTYHPCGFKGTFTDGYGLTTTSGGFFTF